MAGSSKAPIRRLVFASGDQVIGYGASLAGSFKAKHSDIVRKKGSAEWLGFAQIPWGDGSIQIYGLPKASSALCRLAEVDVRKSQKIVDGSPLHLAAD